MNNIPIYVVNLKKDKGKKHYMQNLCDSHGLPCQFVNAVYGIELSDRFIAKVYSKIKAIKYCGRKLSKNEIGCALSHLSIYNNMIELNLPCAVIFEDDIFINNDFNLVIKSLHSVPSDYDIILLGSQSDPDTNRAPFYSFWNRINITNKYRCVRLIQPTYGTYGYLVSLKGAKKLTTHLSKIVQPLDHYIGNDKFINLYAIYPRIISPRDKHDSESNIEVERKALMEGHNKHSSKYYMLTLRLLKYIGILDFLRSMRYLFNRIKPPRKYDI